jgi:hypothetical protein
LATALADADFVPVTYFVDDVSLTVTFSPADVDSPKPDAETLLTLPIDPPAAGPDRAFDPPPPDPTDAPFAAVVEEGVAADELELLLPQAETPITGISSPAVAATDVVNLCLRILFWKVMLVVTFVVSRCAIARGVCDELLSGSRSRTYGQAGTSPPSSRWAW